MMLDEVIEAVYESIIDVSDGEVADYIPGLASADPEDFGLAVVTRSGSTHTAGDTDKPFTIQSVSKAFTFALVLNEYGTDETFTRVGTEPSGDAFNAIELSPDTNTPYNPMINSGAISMANMIHERHGDDSFDFLREKYGEFAGSELGFDQGVYDSEIATASRNRAMAYLMRSFGVVSKRVEEVIDLYTRQCSLTVTAEQLATMGATVASVGTNPRTGITVVDPLVVRHMLSVMFTCGMYDYAGRWAVDVGLPAKSGVSGGVLAVVNRQIGIASYSPRLDSHGNSVRGIQACVALAEEFGLHAFELSNQGSSMLNVYLDDG